jgi:hypothetical protein
MPWDQDYSVESYLQLLIKLTGKHPEEMLEADLRDRLQLEVIKKETVILDEGMYGDVKGEKITLSDGSVYIPKLVERFTENGNHGIDTYEYHHENETPEVMHIGLDSSDPNVDSFTVSEGYGETDLDSDRELTGGYGDPTDRCGCGW